MLSIRPETAGRTIARFDIQLTPDCRIYGLRLIEAENGRRLTYAPSAGGIRLATFAPAMADKITRAACDALEAPIAHDQHAA